MVAVDDDEREMALELFVSWPDRRGEVAAVVLLDEVDDDLRIRLGAEHVSVLLEGSLELAEVLHDPVQDDRDLLVVTTRQRVRVLLGHLAVRRPARVAEPGRGQRAVVLRDLLQVGEVPDRTDVVEALVFQHGQAGRVIASVLEALEAVDEERLCPTWPDISDDPAHALKTSLLKRKSPASPTPRVGGRSTELSSNQVADRSTEPCCLLEIPRLG